MASAPSIYPVIHHVDAKTTFAEVAVARESGADGVFLISHDGEDEALLRVAHKAIAEAGAFPIGLNLLSMDCIQAVQRAIAVGCRMVWADHMGVDSVGLSEEGRQLAALVRTNQALQLFASVAFKYRPHEPNPVAAAENARAAGFVPTTSGAATGSAAEPAKIQAMGAGGALAIASGVTPENVLDYAPHLSHILVATGIARTEHHIDAGLLRALVERVRAG